MYTVGSVSSVPNIDILSSCILIREERKGGPVQCPTMKLIMKHSKKLSDLNFKMTIIMLVTSKIRKELSDLCHFEKRAKS